MAANSAVSLFTPAERSGVEAAAPSQTPGRWCALGVIVAAQFIFVMDAFIVNVAIPAIRADLHASPAALEAILAA